MTYSASMVSSAPAPADFFIDSATGQLTLVSIPDAHGELVLRVLADDGQSADATWSQDISVTVASVNDAPQVVAVPIIPTLVTGLPVAVNIAAAFSDIDGDALTFTATQLPASLGLSVDGQLSGIPQPVDAVAGGLPVTVTAVDGSSATALLELVLIVLDPDTDGDGLSDYQEMLSGFDPQDSDSDGDGFADSLEMLVNFDATDQVLFVREDGDDGATGTTPETALATLDGLTRRINTVAVPGQRVIGLIEAAGIPYSGNLSIGPTESEHVIIGSVTVNDGVVALHSGEVPQTTLKADSRRIVQLQGCQSCTLHHLRFEDSAGALSAINSNVFLGQVHIVNQYVSGNGAALLLEGGEVVIHQSHIAANVAVGRGGAIFATGQSPQVLVRDSIITGNYAFDRGAVLAQNGGDAQLLNTLITGNGAAQAPFAALSRDATVRVTGSTLAYNFVAQTASNVLYAVDRGSRLIPIDNVVVKNRNVVNLDAGITPGASDGGFNLVANGHGVFAGDIETTAGADFIGNYVLGGSLNAGIDSASASATALEPGNRFSVWNSRLPDTGIADRGFHVRGPALSQNNYTVVAAYRDGFGYRHEAYEVDLIIRNDGEPLASGHRVRVGTSAVSPPGQVAGPSLVGVDVGIETITAIDLGSGTFRIWLSADHQPENDRLIVLIDDQTEGVDVIPTCGGSTCNRGPIRTNRR
ncbi:MAG: hypothetical protein HKN70_10295 [Gammaproteobacteria bacterium]|nr:hypothetical protein [Gammaproteobacteria bacterium]